MTENQSARQIVDAAFNLHVALGPVLIESVYQTVLAYELQQRGLHVVRQQPIPVVYQRITLDDGFRADLVVEHKVIVELKRSKWWRPSTKSSSSPTSASPTNASAS